MPTVPRSDSDFADLYRRYRRYVDRSLRRIGVPEADVDDLAQEVFCIVLRRAADLNERGRLHGWLRGVARRVASNHRRATLRRDRKRAWPWADGTLDDPEHAIAVSEGTRFLADFVEGLDEGARDVFVLAEMEGLPGPDVARRVGLELDATYGRIRRVRQRFRDAVRRERLAGAVWVAALPRALAPSAASAGATSAGSNAYAASPSLKMLFAVTTAGAVALGVAVRGSCHRGSNAGDDAGDRIAAATGPAYAAASEVSDAHPSRSGGSIEGRVVDLDDRPITDAQVCAVRPPIGEDFPTGSCTDTDREGRYHLRVLAPSHLQLLARAPGYLPVPAFDGQAFRRVDLRASERRAGIDLVLEPGGREVRGSVRDILGGGIEGARVAATWGDGTLPWAEATTEPDGRFALWVDGQNSVIVRAEASGYVPESQYEFRPTGEAFELTLYPESALEGRVIDAGTGRGVPDVPIVLGIEPTSDLRVKTRRVHATSDEDGRFRIGQLRPGRYKPAVRHDGWLGQVPAAVALELGETIDGLELRVHPARQIRGRIESSDGTPCMDGEAILQDGAEQSLAAAPTEPDGSVHFGGLLPGLYRVVASCGHSEQTEGEPIELADADRTDMRFVVEPRVAAGTLVLRGVVRRADGTPATFATVEAVREERLPDGSMVGPVVQTDRAGAYRIEGIPPGDYRIRVDAGSSGTYDGTSPIDVRDAETRADVELAPVGTLRIRTVDPDGHAVAGVELFVGPSGSMAGSWITSDREGWAEIDGLSDIEYGVRVSRPGVAGRAGPVDPTRDDDATPVSIVAGETTDLIVVVPARDGTIRGRAVRTDGDPVADADVVVLSKWTFVSWTGEDQAATVARARTDGEGAFTVEGLEPGTYELSIRDAFRQRQSISAATGTDVRVELPLPGSVSGTIVGPDGRVPSSFTVSVESSGATLTDLFLFTDGAWSLVGVPPGSATVSVSTAEGRAQAQVAIPEDGVADSVALRLAPRASVSVQVLDGALGTPIVGAYVVVRASGAPGKSAKSNADGEVELDAVPSGEVEVIVFSPRPLVWQTYHGQAALQAGRNVLDPISLQPVTSE
jgi:RNA polymerase sigma-70 factor (ECF subfamily)